MRVKRRIVTALAAAALASTATLTTGVTPASADSFLDYGRTEGTGVAFAGCQGWVHSGVDNANSLVYARAEFSLPTSTRGLPCMGWLERRTSSTAPWATVSGYHFGPDTTTGWYYDMPPYSARVCVGDFLYSNSYSCGGSPR
jgi:hypothetical protein